MKIFLTNIEIDVFIMLIIITLWMILCSFIIVLHLLYRRVNYKIHSKFQVIKNILVVLSLLFFLSLLGFLRILRKAYSLDIKELFKVFKQQTSELLLGDVTLWVVFGLFCLLFYLLIMVSFYKTVKESTIKLLTYFYQYKKIKKFYQFYSHHFFRGFGFLRGFVFHFTKDERYLLLAFLIWPKSWYILEKILFFGFVPYMIYFDILVNDAVIKTIFPLMPWYFIYSLWRSFDQFFKKFLTSDFRMLSLKYYSKRY